VVPDKSMFSLRKQTVLWHLVAALLSQPIPVFGQEAAAIDADVLLQGGTIIDGTGSPGFVGDIAIVGDKIVAVGQFDHGKIGRKIDCRGLIVAPGFIDLHNHSDSSDEEDSEIGETEKLKSRQILKDKTRESVCYLTQGCTTIVTGNCGGGAVDVAAYYAALDARPAGVNVAHLIPHGSLRSEVIGPTRRPPTDKELARMQELARAQMQAGAWGMSTGLQYVPGSFADVNELAAIAQVVGAAGGIYASHIRDEGDQLLESIDEALEIGRRAHLPIHISHLKASKQSNWGKVKAAAAMIRAARDAGLRVTADQYPYDASSTSISAMLLPDEEREGGTQAVIAKLDDPAQAARLRKLVTAALADRGPIMIARSPEHPAWIGKLISDVAQAENRSETDVALDILRSSDDQGVSFSMNEDDVRYVMTLPWVATASDGSVKVEDGTNPHPRSFGTFSRRIGHYAIAEGVVPLEQAVRSATGLPAEILGLEDRGLVKPGTFADVVVFDPPTFRDHATYQSPFQLSTGVKFVLVNGRLAIDEGKPAHLAAGMALRKPR
ncbi:MAG: amidohydrolase family protein, partial [Pirellulales bacterium]